MSQRYSETAEKPYDLRLRSRSSARS